MLGIGIVGCGNISTRYLQNAPMFAGVKICAVTDVNFDAAKRQGDKFGIAAVPMAKFWKRDDVEAIINITVPNAHVPVSMQALKSGRHVFSEKPLAVSYKLGKQLVDEAERRGLLLACAPDTILGPGHQLARRLIDEGRIGKVVAGVASFMSRGMEHWHPDPTFFFQPGGGPVLDMGPYYISALVNLIGPVRRVVAMGGKGLAERIVTAEGPMKGRGIKVDVPTTNLAVLEMDNGALVSCNLSWDVFKHSHRPLEIHGTEGSLRCPDPNFFAGDVEFSEGRGDWQVVNARHEPCSKPNHPDVDPVQANYRVLGVADLAAALKAKRQPRMSGRLGLHVLEVMEAILKAGESGKSISIKSCERPAALSGAQTAKLLVDAKATVAG